MTYGCETWKLTKQTEKSLRIAQRAMERVIPNMTLQVDLFLFLSVIPNIALSMVLCAILSKFSVCFVNFQVSHPYGLASIKH